MQAAFQYVLFGALWKYAAMSSKVNKTTVLNNMQRKLPEESEWYTLSLMIGVHIAILIIRLKELQRESNVKTDWLTLSFLKDENPKLALSFLKEENCKTIRNIFNMGTYI